MQQWSHFVVHRTILGYYPGSPTDSDCNRRGIFIPYVFFTSTLFLDPFSTWMLRMRRNPERRTRRHVRVCAAGDLCLVKDNHLLVVRQTQGCFWPWVPSIPLIVEPMACVCCQNAIADSSTQNRQARFAFVTKSGYSCTSKGTGSGLFVSGW